MAGASSFDPNALSGLSTNFESFDNAFEDSLNFGDGLALEDDLFFPPDWNQHTPPYNVNASTWDTPQPKMEPASMAAYSTMSTLTSAQQEKLRNIAMPNHLQYRGYNSPLSAASTKSQSVSSPDSNSRDTTRKRKSSADVEDEDDDEDSSEQHPPVKKTAHNMIEKRYRTNLNDKIAALRDSVPSLRIMSKSARGEDTADDREELQGLTPAHKLNKATVLSKATEYINHLEKRNKRLQDENHAQKARLAAFETLFRSGSMGFNPQPVANPFQFSPEYVTPGHSPSREPQGMIQVPEDMRKLHGRMNQQTYPVPQEQYQQQVRQQLGRNGWPNSGYFGKLMVGSLAGLMIMEGFSEAEQENEAPSARGLFALPTQLLRSASQSLHSSANFSAWGYHVSSAQTIGWMKTALAIGTLLYIFLPTLFTPKSESKHDKKRRMTVAAAPSLASPIQVRRQAWLTAIQTVWVPRHNFFLEAAALCLKMAKLSMRHVVGPQGYAYITGITPQQEAARVKAWTIALDAQLAGGDIEISKSRLTLTFLASSTLPDSPARLMLKALHIRVLLWEVGNAGFNGFYMFKEIAAQLAQWRWNEARQLQRIFAHTKDDQEDDLPEYLAALLEEDCDDVLTDAVNQRAYNLAWNLPTSHNTQDESDDLNTVVEDLAIRSSLDAVAAWYSGLVLKRALMNSLDPKAADSDVQASITKDIDLAIRTAPIGSGAQIRALVARALVSKEKQGFNIAASLQALGPLAQSGSPQAEGTSLINTSTSIANLPDIKMSLRCAMALAHLSRFPAPANPEAAHRIISSIVPVKLTFLGFTAVFKLMEEIHKHELVSVSCSGPLEKLAGFLRVWIGGQDGERSGLDRETRKIMIDRCLKITKHIVGMVDAGYGSMSEEEPDDGC